VNGWLSSIVAAGERRRLVCEPELAHDRELVEVEALAAAPRCAGGPPPKQAPARVGIVRP
jgi:hypothetical protein